MNMTKETFRRVRSWILRNGRPLEAARYAFHFENGSAQDVLELLSLYQNPDGGFGQTLEPDSWNPHSSPYTTSNALGVLREIGVTDFDHPVYQGILRYLSSKAGFADGLWQFAIPSNDAYPHAPWWSFSPEANAEEGLGLSAVLAAFALDAASPDTPLYQTALEIARQTLDRLMTGGRFGVMGIDGCMALRHCWESLGMADGSAERLSALVNGAIVRDPAMWEQYVPRPSAAISSPESPFYVGNEAAVESELDYLLRTLPKDDVWPINWCWFDLQERYADAFAVSERWWKASKAIDTLRLLKAFGRIEE